MATTTKKPTRKKAPAKKTTHRKATKTGQKVHSFRVTKDYTPFFTFRITRQTVYWLILVAFVIVMQIWVLSVLNQVNTAINDLTIQSSRTPLMTTKK